MKRPLTLLLFPFMVLILGIPNPAVCQEGAAESEKSNPRADLIPIEKLPPKVSEEKQAASKKLYEAGLAIEKTKDLDGAIAKWKEALKTDPRNAACMNHYAWFLAVTAPKEKKDVDRALALARRSALVTELKNHDILDTVAEIHFIRKEYKLAVAVQKVALQALPMGKGKRRYLLKQLHKFEEAAGGVKESGKQKAENRD